MRRLAVAVLVLLVSTAIGQTSYTMQDVAKHNTAADCWMVLNGNKVYNLTKFIGSHPGGSGMASSCGTDGTARYNSVGHSGSATSQEAQYQIGVIGVAPPPPPATVGVTVSPTSANLKLGDTQQFTATLTNSTQGVTWSGTGTAGTVDQNGRFTSTGIGTEAVTATSKQDQTKTAVAQIAVVAVPPPPPPPPTTAISVAITPVDPTIKVGTQGQFTATVQNSTKGVTWNLTLRGKPVGLLTPRGAVAALTAASPGVATVTATSVEDTSKSASVTVTVTPSTQPPVPPGVRLTASEVAKHAVAGNCWMIINGSVYDVTTFIPVHPLAGAPMIPQCGRDASGPFAAATHSGRAMTLLPHYLLGVLVPEPPPPPPPTPGQCSLTQSQSRQRNGTITTVTITCPTVTPSIPVSQYKCTYGATKTGVSVTCQNGGGGGHDD